MPPNSSSNDQILSLYSVTTSSMLSSQLSNFSNTHSMLTHSKLSIYKTKICLAIAIKHNVTEPIIVKEAFNDPFWKDSLRVEFEVLVKNDS